MQRRIIHALLVLLVLALILKFAGQTMAQEGILKSLNLFPVNENGLVDSSAAEQPVAMLIDPDKWLFVEVEGVALLVHKDALKVGSNWFVGIVNDEPYLFHIVKRGQEIFIRGVRKLTADEYTPRDLPEVEAFPA